MAHDPADPHHRNLINAFDSRRNPQQAPQPVREITPRERVLSKFSRALKASGISGTTARSLPSDVADIVVGRSEIELQAQAPQKPALPSVAGADRYNALVALLQGAKNDGFINDAQWKSLIAASSIAGKENPTPTDYQLATTAVAKAAVELGLTKAASFLKASPVRQ